MGAPSEKAIDLYWCDDCDGWYSYPCLLSAHHQADRVPVEFVRLRDVLMYVRCAVGHVRTTSKEQACSDMADFLEREFGGVG